MKRAAFAFAFPVLAIVIAFACAPTSGSVNVVLPDRASFPPVDELLVRRCGTLDCHGSTTRTLRIYGSLGLRLAPSDRPLSKGTTTTAEYDETFASIVGLEPELTGDVVSSGGAAPDRLGFYRKGRGLEDHKGGTLFFAGDAADRCVTSWLSGSADAAACNDAIQSSF